jgi:phosphosulfolactate synthase (CoM biosynthesis protein A)
MKKSPSLPSHLSADDKKVVRKTMGKNLGELKRDNVIVYEESLPEIDACLTETRQSIEHVKMHSADYRRRKDDMREFVEICTSHGVKPYVGGGQAELAMSENRLFSYTADLHSFGIDTIEISNDKGELRKCERQINSLRKDFKTVLIEVGDKYADFKHENLSQWEREMKTALNQEPDAIIFEGGGGGNVGIYHSSCQPNPLLVQSLLDMAGDKKDSIIIESPERHQAEFWINEMGGWKTRLGNLPLDLTALKEVAQFRVNAMRPIMAGTIEEMRKVHAEKLQAIIEICKKEGVDKDLILFDDDVYGVSAFDTLISGNWKQELRAYIKGGRTAEKLSQKLLDRMLNALNAMQNW